jgi:CRISPR-associated protein Cst2
MYNLFGNILTAYGTAANNHGETQGTLARLQKLLWHGETHTTVSAEAIRWSLRYTWQRQGLEVNRVWQPHAADPTYQWQNPDFDPDKYLDDDILGFMHVEAAKLDNPETAPPPAKPGRRQPKNKPKGKAIKRRGALDVTPAISTRPFHGDITFNARGGIKDSNSLYATERHATYYQYGFCLSPEYLHQQHRIIRVLDGLTGIDKVAGNHGRFLFDFAPTNIVLRWTQDLSPRLLYCFDQDEQEQLSLADLIYKVESGDINSKELWIGGSLTQELQHFQERGANLYPGIVPAVNALKEIILRDLKIQEDDLARDLKANASK